MKPDSIHRRGVSLLSVVATAALVCGLMPAPLHGEDTAGGPDYTDLEKRVHSLLNRLTETAQVRQRLETATASLTTVKAEEIQRITDETDRLKKKAEAEERELNSMVTPDLPVTLSLADLNRKLAEATSQRDGLLQSLAAAPQPEKPAATGGIPGTVIKQDLKSIGVMLVRNRVVPLKVPYFSATNGPGINRLTGERLMVARIHRVSEGTPIGDAIRQGNLIDKLIAEEGGSQNTHYFFIKVCPDSIPAYQVIVKAIQARGFDYSWDTGQDKDWFMPANGGGGSGNGSVRVVPAQGN